MRKRIISQVILLLLLSAAAGADRWAQVIPTGRQWSFPADHRSHPEYKTEWWYVTGQLESADDPGRHFGYQFTFFRVGLLPEKPNLDSLWAADSLIMGHASITDVANGKHWFSEVLWRNSPLFGSFGGGTDTAIASCMGPAGTSTWWSLAAEGDGFRIRMEDRRQEMAFDLLVSAEKPMVFQGPGGVSRKGEEPGAASYYYSFTRMKTSGAITTGSGSLEVNGTSWMDREFFSSELTGGQTGWDWFSIQMEDGRELMIYQVRTYDGTPAFGRGTMIPVEGDPVYLDLKTDWELKVTGSWSSPETGISYPSGWELSVGGQGGIDTVRLTITPIIPNQENVSRRSGLAYWEGAVTVHPAGAAPGSPPIGRGYAELTGYGEDNRPPV